MKNSKITINVESLGDETVKANFTGGAKNFNELMSLGGAVLQTFLNSAGEIIKRNDDELDMPDEILHLTILDALVDKVCNLVQTEKTDNTDNEKKVDDFLSNILNGLKGDED
jgi:hypothetical protein